MIGAIVLAAGLSRRMGSPKMVLPWGYTTVIGTVVNTLVQADMHDIWVVTGGARGQVVQALAGYKVEFVYNPNYLNEEMLASIQAGLAAMPAMTGAADGAAIGGALLVLGDQPQIQERVVRAVIQSWSGNQARIVMPSYRMRRGHPWILPRTFWTEVRLLKSPLTMRDFIRAHENDIEYVEVDTVSIIQDLDTPEQYQEEIKRGSEGRTVTPD
jgi:molybdenum cofactor cytidylyltransferase